MTTSNITIAVEFLAGTSIEDVLAEARSKAIEWNVAYIKFNFNGISVSCSKDFDVGYWAKEYMNVMKEKKTYMICTRRGEK